MRRKGPEYPQASLGSRRERDSKGSAALVLGVANKRSIAWAIARRLADEGAQLAFTYQGERIEKSVRELAESVSSPLVTECDVRSDEDVDPRRPGGRRDVRRPARPPRPLGRVRRGRGSRGPLHRHAARPLLDGARRERVLARRVRPRGGAADGGRRRRLDPDDDLSRRRASGAALQRDGRREGGARRVGALPRLGPRPEERARERRLGRPGANARRPLDRTASRRWRRSSRSARRCTATSTPTTSPRRRVPALGRGRNVTGTTLYVDSGYHAMGM